jgi:predicted Zn-dependent peptidase
MPELQEVKPGRFPEVQRSQLENGLQIILAPRPGAPTVVVEALLNAGFANDGEKSGLASLTMAMLDEGTRSMNALEINEQLQLLGASLRCAAGLDRAYVRLSTLKQSLTQSLLLFGEILVHPTFPPDELERLKKEHLAAIQREQSNPMPMALRVVPQLLYGVGHRYAQPLTGTGYAHSLDRISREDVLTFYENWIRPNNAKLIITGDLTMQEAKDLIENSLHEWISASVPINPEPEAVQGTSDTLYLLDRPESLQSMVIGAYLIDAYRESTAIATEHMNDVLGGQFISRINLNLREDKHWTYGARSLILETKGQRPFLTYASVQIDKTVDSIHEIRKEFSEFIQDRPVTQAEFDKNQKNAILALPGQWETNAAVADSLAAIVKLGLPDDYFQYYPELLQRLSLREVHEISQDIVRPDALNWVIVGDREKIWPSLVNAGFRKIVHIDAEGKAVDRT